MRQQSGQTSAAGDAAGSSAELGRLIRPVAALGILALVLGRVIAPALKGAFNGIDRVIRGADILAGVSSQGLAFAVTALSIGALLVISRDRQVSLVVRALLIPQTLLVLLIGIWATRKPLANPALLVSGLMASLAAIVASVQGLRKPRTRALGVVLSVTGVAALVHVAAGWFSLRGGLPALAGALSSASLVLHAGALVVALVWLATRRRTLVPPATMAALFAAVLLTWAASKGARPNATEGWIFAWRSLEALLPSPSPGLPSSLALFLAVLSPCLALAALSTRRQVPSVIGALTLVLLAGVLVDAPVQAMILTLAGLSTVLASRDDRGMWEVLIGRPLRGGPAEKS
jgi:hypothetical protein